MAHEYGYAGFSQRSFLQEDGDDGYAGGAGGAGAGAGGGAVATYDPALDAFKVMADPVHERVVVPEVVRRVLDTQPFQRLRDLKQLGTCYLVFPGANHNRFEHSLGVSHLSGESLEFMAERSAFEVTRDINKCVRIAGLVHDLGHGPFSHVFDGQFIPTVIPGSTWTHEDMSEAMLEYLLDSHGIDVLDGPVDGLDAVGYADGRDVVKSMVQGRKRKLTGAGVGLVNGVSASSPHDFLFEIVANKETGIDTDKFDYLYRDAHALALPRGFDYKRIMYSQRVLGGRIAYSASTVQDIYEMFHFRYTMFNKIYLHRATRSLEVMLCDVLREADAAWGGRLRNAINDPQEYTKLQDTALLNKIEFSTKPALARARSILGDMRRRKLYRFVDEVLLPRELTAPGAFPSPTPEEIAGCNTDPNVDLRPEHIAVHDLKLDYGKKDENPVDSALFYRSSSAAGEPAPFRIPRDRVSLVGIPSTFRERKLRVYSRANEPAYLRAILGAFRSWLRRHGYAHHSTHHSSKAWDAVAAGGGDADAGGDGAVSDVAAAAAVATAAAVDGGVLGPDNSGIYSDKHRGRDDYEFSGRHVDDADVAAAGGAASGAPSRDASLIHSSGGGGGAGAGNTSGGSHSHHSSSSAASTSSAALGRSGSVGGGLAHFHRSSTIGGGELPDLPLSQLGGGGGGGGGGGTSLSQQSMGGGGGGGGLSARVGARKPYQLVPAHSVSGQSLTSPPRPSQTVPPMLGRGLPRGSAAGTPSAGATGGARPPAPAAAALHVDAVTRAASSLAQASPDSRLPHAVAAAGAGAARDDHAHQRSPTPPLGGAARSGSGGGHDSDDDEDAALPVLPLPAVARSSSSLGGLSGSAGAAVGRTVSAGAVVMTTASSQGGGGNTKGAAAALVVETSAAPPSQSQRDGGAAASQGGGKPPAAAAPAGKGTKRAAGGSASAPSATTAAAAAAAGAPKITSFFGKAFAATNTGGAGGGSGSAGASQAGGSASGSAASQSQGGGGGGGGERDAKRSKNA